MQLCLKNVVLLLLLVSTVAAYEKNTLQSVQTKEVVTPSSGRKQLNINTVRTCMDRKSSPLEKFSCASAE